MTTIEHFGEETDDGLDGPEAFAEAAETYCAWYPGADERGVADALSRLARAGLIVSAAYHDEVCGQYAAQYARVEAAANELVARLEVSS